MNWEAMKADQIYRWKGGRTQGFELLNILNFIDPEKESYLEDWTI